ncbi:glycosyltransferase involved in cell wall biosynthesis [Aquimarina sp. EL_43]|uniref:glycosyltransferase family 4 protein n=1 Tax=unclassified Aquimarina TaxID=2627091 RepID=UPI0018CAD9CA|nr:MULTISPECIES: glycosyltransferase family 4 protein [unclassified Aquimarina]MBG6129916.1 glycosyltransferase involved in cell wall biosynthesis [Aquimarina sp. EL_35]MBG6150981.1 glycosyltransferase involved in cell wall biosynthesis [Aquimarina sp. EL_32]MBG6167712.1 glycosyltransferase involved in cell wall biosynthesis [Aquimarina sp. EL_43]
MQKIIRVTTVPISLGKLLQGQLKFMSQYYDIIGVSGKGEGQLDMVSQNEGVRVIPVEMTRKITPIKDLKAVYRLYKVFKKEKPQIVHSHTPKAGTLSMLAAKLAGVPHRLHTIAGLPLLEATGAKRVLLDTVEKATYTCATKIYPNSSGLNDIIIANKYTSSKKLKVIANGSSNGIDTSFFDPGLYTKEENLKLSESLGIKSTDTVIIYVGRLVKDKGIHELIDAFKKLNTASATVKLLLVGTYEKDLDPLSPDTEEEINTNPNIITVGWQNDVRPYFAISDILAFPSYREGFPNVVMQAASMGLASVVTDINGCNEIITEGINGKIIPVKDAEQLFQNLKMLVEDKPQRDTLAGNARESITSRYERKVVWEALLEEYRTL